MRTFASYPIGTKAFSSTGGFWEKTERGWRWLNGSTFPTPGADVLYVTMPDAHINAIQQEQERITK